MGVRNSRAREFLERYPEYRRSVTGSPPSPPPPPVDKDSGKPDDDGMESRVATLETLVKSMATKEDLARLEGSFRTELHREIGAQTWKLVTFVCGFGTALVAATYFVAKHVS